MIIYRILGSIERYSNYERLFAEDKGVQAAIGDLYGDLVDFCSRVVRFHSKHFRSVFVNFDHEFGLVSDLIAFHTSQVDLAANAAHMVQSSEAQQASFSMQESMSALRMSLEINTRHFGLQQLTSTPYSTRTSQHIALAFSSKH